MKHIQGVPADNVSSFPIAIIVSRFNTAITQELLKGALNRLSELQVVDEDIVVIEVPGAIEIPLVAKTLANQERFKAIIALGAVIRGETSHYDYVCQQVSHGCQQVALQYNTPVIFGVLTTENEEQAWDRLGGNHGHKGIESADAAIEMYHVLKQL